MLFSSTEFLFLFLPMVLLVYHVVLRGLRQQQNTFLLVASLFFYAWGEPWFVLIMMGSILMNYGFGLWAHRYRHQCRRLNAPIACAVGCNLGLLFVFKYLTFTLSTLNGVLGGLWVPIINLPIGISFFTFQALSYVLDVAWGKVEVQRSPRKLGLYIALFPQLIAGPIVKYATIAHEIDHRQENWTDLSSGACRFMVGLSKKVLLSNQLALVADAAWSAQALTTPMAWLGSLCYTLQIFYDFSGYSDMAIGLGQMFGFHFLENFNFPYIATSITDFWRRWHISLSSWFRDYLYIPLGGSRVTSTAKLVRNLFVVWLFTGIWHGANWTFLLWGLFYFLLLMREKFLPLWPSCPRILCWSITFALVNFGWVLFRAPSLPQAGTFLVAMLGQGAQGANPSVFFYLEQYSVILLLSVIGCFPISRWMSKKATPYLAQYAPHVFPIWDVFQGLLLLFAFALSVSFLVKGTYNPFIYFNF